MTELTDREIVSKLARYIGDAMNSESDDGTTNREDNYDRYIGKPYGNERAGYSKVVTREVFETVEWALPSILRVFTSGDRVVSFDANGPEDEKEANQETDLANHFIVDKADGFIHIHDWVKSAMLYPNAYLKVSMDECERREVREYTGLSRFGLQKVLSRFGDNIEILEQDSYQIEPPEANDGLQQAQEAAAGQAQAVTPQGPPQAAPQVAPGAPAPGGAPQGGPGAPQAPAPAPQAEPAPIGPQGAQVAPPPGYDTTAFDIKIRVTRKERELKLQPVPGDQVLIERGFSGHNLDEANFICHRSRQTYTDLVYAGYDEDQLKDIGPGQESNDSTEEDNRLFFEEEDGGDDALDGENDALREFWVHECFVRIDVDGDGLAERRRIVLIGNEVFENEEDDYNPLVGLSSILIPHRHIGMSIADAVKDLQLISTTLRRQLLDNIYRLNIRKKYVGRRFLEDGGITIDALMDPTSEIVPANDPTQLIPEQVQPIVADLLPVIQDLDNTKQVRTGIAPNLSLDPEVLQQSTMGAFSQSLEQASQRIEMMVRVFAETGFKHLMLKVHRLLRTNMNRAKTYKLRGEWVEVDPTSWLDRPNVKVNVGLGFHNKDAKVQMLGQLLSIQKEALGFGLTDAAKIYQTLDDLVEAAGLGTGKTYFNNPKDPGYQAPQPPQDPMAEAAQAQLQVEMGKLQNDQQKLQTETQKAQGNFTIELEKLKGYLGEITARIGNIEQDTKLKEAQTAEVYARIGMLHVDGELKTKGAEREDRREEREDTRSAFEVAQGIRGAAVEDDEREYGRESEREDKEHSRATSEREFGLREKEIDTKAKGPSK